jgi:hypothetical protein
LQNELKTGSIKWQRNVSTNCPYCALDWLPEASDSLTPNCNSYSKICVRFLKIFVPLYCCHWSFGLVAASFRRTIRFAILPSQFRFPRLSFLTSAMRHLTCMRIMVAVLQLSLKTI